MEEVQTETWDPKKILIALVLFALVAVGFKTLVLDRKSTNSQNNQSNVEGVSVSQTPTPLPTSTNEIKKNIENKLIELKKEVNNINVAEVATSTPAVKKILNDLQNLQSFPQNQARESCLKICNGL